MVWANYTIVGNGQDCPTGNSTRRETKRKTENDGESTLKSALTLNGTSRRGKLRTTRSGGSWLEILQWYTSGRPDYGIGDGEGVCVCVCTNVCVCVCVSLSLSLYLSIYLSINLSIYLALSRPLSLPPLPLHTPPLSLSLSLSLSPFWLVGLFVWSFVLPLAFEMVGGWVSVDD